MSMANPVTMSSLYNSQQIVTSSAKTVSRTDDIKMFAGGAQVPAFTIKQNQSDIVEMPWGMPRCSEAEMAAAADDTFVPDMQRRTIMNLVLLGGAAVPVGWMGGGFIYFFVPPAPSGAGSGT
jgi:hypothetical protein